MLICICDEFHKHFFSPEVNTHLLVSFSKRLALEKAGQEIGKNTSACISKGFLLV